MSLAEKVLANLNDITRTVVFVGSGLSIKSGMKDWENSIGEVISICERMKRPRAETDFYKIMSKDAQYYELMDLLFSRIGRVEYLNILEEVFRKDVDPVKDHELLAGIPFAGFITTNFDKLIESALYKVKGKMIFHHTNQSDGVRALLSWQKQFLFKMHGDIDMIDQLVINKRDVDNLIHREDIEALFRRYLLSYQVLFLGYGFRDPDFHSVWQVINNSSKLRAPGILVSQLGSFDSEAKKKLLELNIQVFEPDDFDSDFLFVSELLDEMSRVSAKLSGTPPEIYLNEKVLMDSSLLLIQLFDEETENSFHKFLKSIVMSRFLEHEKGIPTEDVIGYCTELLSIDNDEFKSKIGTVLHELALRGMIVPEGKNLRLDSALRERYMHEKIAFSAQVDKVMSDVLSRAQRKIVMPAAHDDLQNFRDLIFKIVEIHGKELAQHVLFYKRIIRESDEFDSVLKEFLRSRNLQDRENLYSHALRELVNNSTEEEESILFRLLQMYYLTSSYALSPNSEKLLREYVQRFEVYVDSNIIIKALAPGHPNCEISRRLIDKTRTLGIKVKILDRIFDEVAGHAELARQTYRELMADAGDKSDFDMIGAYVELVGGFRANTFLYGYYKSRSSNKELTWNKYMAENPGGIKRGALKSKTQIAHATNDLFGAEIQSCNFTEAENTELKKLTEEVVSLRKLGGAFRDEKLCEDEAAQFLWIQGERLRNKSASDKIWFVTNDHFISELFDRNSEKYSSPVSYSPAGWYQYLQLLDYDARASKSFSRLFTFSEIGALDDELAVGAIREMLKKEESLIKSGALSVHEFANQLISKYHIRKVFTSYDKSRRDGPTKEKVLTEIRETVSKAASEFVAVKKSEIERQKRTEEELALTKTKLVQEKYKRKQNQKKIQELISKKEGGKRSQKNRHR